MRTLIALAATLITLAAPAAVAAERVEVSLAWSDDLQPGSTATLGVVLEISPTWHIQAGKGSGDEHEPYIPTTVEITLPGGWKTDEAKWPDAHRFVLGTPPYAETLAGYQGRSTIRIPVEVPADAAPGEQRVKVTVGYQACDDMYCEPPTSVSVAGTAVVLAADGGTDGDTDAGTGAGSRLTLPGLPTAPTAPLSRERVEVSLFVYEGEMVPGREANVGVLFDVQTFWHVQAGLGSGDEIAQYIPTQVTLNLPDGWSAGDVRWPEAHAFTLGTGDAAEEIAGYEGRVMAVVPVAVPEDAAAGELELTATVTYQACDDKVCEMPVTLDVSRTVRVIASPDEASNVALDAAIADLFQTTLARDLPALDGAGTASESHAKPERLEFVNNVRWWLAFALTFVAMAWMVLRTFAISKSTVTRLIVAVMAVAITWGAFAFVRGTTGKHDVWTSYSAAAFDAAKANGDNTILIKFTAAWCANCQVNERMIMGDKDALAELQRPDVIAFKVDLTGANPDGEAKKEELGGGGIPLIAVYHPSSPEPVVIRGQLLSTQPVIDALRGEGKTYEVPEGAVLVVLGLAFVAGFFMNFTPCVLPVIPIKILSLQAHAKHPARCFFLGLIFGLGIVAAYAVLGIAMAGVLSAGGRMDWGAHFQNWWVNMALGLFVVAMAIGMLGVFAIRLPQFLYMFNPQSETTGGSFFMGVFTAVLSTPCTGPLLGATVAWTAKQPAWIAFTTLVVMGLGMAFPYVLLTAKPAWLERLPRTGPGSELVKQVMGLLMLAVGAYFVLTGVSGLMA